MEVVGAVASFIAIGEAIAAIPKVVSTFQSVVKADSELVALIEEVSLY